MKEAKKDSAEFCKHRVSWLLGDNCRVDEVEEDYLNDRVATPYTIDESVTSCPKQRLPSNKAPNPQDESG